MQDSIDAERKQAQMLRNTVQGPSTSEQIANAVSMMPLSDYFRMRQRVMRLGAFCDHLANAIQ